MPYKEIVERALACFAEPSRRGAYFDIYADDVTLHGYAGVEPGLDSVKQYYSGIWSAFPDACVDAEEMIDVDDRVILRFTMTGTHKGPFLGLDATGRSI